jgi:RNA polymerase sigma-70 factor, ECF subfamily
MEPPVRLYNSNGAGEPRKRAARTSKRTATAESRPAARAVRTSTPPPAVATPAAEPIVAAPAPEVEVVPQGDAGPVVGIADFEEIFTRFQTPITNFVFRLVGNREQAYDLTQDVFVKAYRALSSGTTIQAAALSSWLYRIASNTATDALRRRRLISWLPLSLFNEDRGVGAGLPGAENPTAQQSAEEAYSGAANALVNSYDGGRFEQRVADREIVEAVLKKLPPKYAACLLLYEHEGFSCAEIAEVLNVSASAVKMRLMRARERFIVLYKQETSAL